MRIVREARALEERVELRVRQPPQPARQKLPAILEM